MQLSRESYIKPNSSKFRQSLSQDEMSALSTFTRDFTGALPIEEGAAPVEEKKTILSAETIAFYNTIRAEINKGRNIRLSGPGGSGKSEFLKWLNRNALDVALTSTMGLSAYNIGGRTIHSWAGIGKGQDSVDAIYKSLGRKAVDRWMTTRILVIDEISLMAADVFDKINILGQRVRNNKRPFGGIIVVVSGDFMQLPPIRAKFAFKSNLWNDMQFHKIAFTKVYRFTDTITGEIMDRCRFACMTEEDDKILASRVIAFKNKEYDNDLGIVPTQVFPLRKDVDYCNITGMSNLDTPEVTFNAKDEVTTKNKAYAPKSEEVQRVLEDVAPAVLVLKVDAQVMITYNIDVEAGIFNGTRGVITEIGDNYVIVRTLTNKLVRIDKVARTYKYSYDVTLTRTQIPIILAWALTVHKCQGCTLDFMITAIDKTVFDAGMAYTMLSRCRSIYSLYLRHYDRAFIRCNRDAEEFETS